MDWGSGGTVAKPTAADLIGELYMLVDQLHTDAMVKGNLHHKLALLREASAGCGSIGKTGPMEQLTCSGSSGESDVTFAPFEEAFSANLSDRIRGAKANGHRVCFCR